MRRNKIKIVGCGWTLDNLIKAIDENHQFDRAAKFTNGEKQNGD